MIELKGLCKSFEEKEVLTDINATFENGKTNLTVSYTHLTLPTILLV